MSNPFVLNADQYKRQINPLKDYIEQTAQYLSISTGKDIELCKNFVRKKLKDGSHPVVDPQVQYMRRGDNGDRSILKGSLKGYIYDTLKEDNIFVPSFTTYLKPHVKESMLVKFIDDNIAGRSKAKKEEFAAKAKGLKDLAQTKNLEQTGRKLSNNAISGAHVSNSTPLVNKTAHSSLTSTCRSTSGYGNANNEKLMTGNRHYWNPNVTINNIISIIMNTDYEYLQKTVNKYNIHLPTVSETMQCIQYSSDMYWRNIEATNKIEELVAKLSPIQRAAFVYTGDLYHFRLYNDSLVRDFIGKLSLKVSNNPNIEDSYSFVKSSKGEYLDLAHQICSDEMKGKGKDYDAIKGTSNLLAVASTTNNIDNTLNEYADIIKIIMVTNNLPASVGYFPESVRRAALTSDTDSTIFTVDEWVTWYFGYTGFSNEHMSVAAVCIFLASQAITHILAMMSANFGVEQKRIHQIAMKNEFKFDVFVPTNVAKHYFASISCQEGNVFKESESEIKGVHLKNSNAPKFITKRASEMMEEIMDSIKKTGKVSILKYLKEIGDMERGIFESIKKGELQFFRLGEIKPPDSYVREAELSPYLYHILWMDVFEPKYGTEPITPYQVIRLSTTIDNPTKTKKWLDEMQDRDLAKRMTNWMTKYDKKQLPSLLLPVEAITGNGIPQEILDIIDTRKIVYNLCKVFYLVLETLGFYICNKNITRLVSDQY